jgi:hypothetical protein
MARNRTVDTASMKLEMRSPFSPPTSASAGAEQDREEQHLQHVVARQRVERGGRNDVEQEAADAAALQLVGVVGDGRECLAVERGGIDVHAVAGAEQIGQHQADDERQRGHGLEIDQRLDADPADLLEVACAGDAMHHHTEHDGGHDHGDEFEKGVAEDLQADGEVRHGDAQHDAEQQGDKHLHEERLIERLAGWFDGGNRSCGHGSLPLRFTNIPATTVPPLGANTENLAAAAARFSGCREGD